MSDFYRQQSSKNNDDYNNDEYNPFQDEKLPWERDEMPQQAQNTSLKYMNRSERPRDERSQQAQNTSLKYMNHSERPRANASVRNASNKPWEMNSNNSPFSAMNFNMMPLPHKCKWIEKNPYPVLECKGGNWFFIIFGFFWTLPFAIMFCILVNQGGLIEVLSELDGDSWFIAIFPIIGIIFIIVGINQAFKRTWITNKGDFLEVERGFKRQGNIIQFYTETSAMSYGSNTTVNNEAIYWVKLEDRSSGHSVVIADGLRIHQVHTLLNFMQYYFKVR
jgi:hypothetical protein